MPPGAVAGVKYRTADPMAATIRIGDDPGTIPPVTVPAAEMAAALAGLCIDRGIMLPKGADRSVELIDGSIALIIALKPELSPLIRPPGAKRARSFSRPPR